MHEDVLDRHRTRMQDARAMMRRRSALAEHPFGTLKCRAGYRHFLVRGLAAVRGEWSLMTLCYNFTRVLAILGLEGFMERLAEWIACLLQVGTPDAGRALLRIAGRLLARFATEIPATAANPRQCLALAT